MNISVVSKIISQIKVPLLEAVHIYRVRDSVELRQDENSSEVM